MKKLLQFFVTIIAVAGVSCFFSGPPENRLDAESRVLENAALVPHDSSDAEISPLQSDIACDNANPCVTIDKGCCSGEKPVAVNLASSKRLRGQLIENCMVLFASKAKQNINNVCSERQKPMSESQKALCNNKKCEIPELPDAKPSHEDSDVACSGFDSCVAIDEGCCAGEKRVAVNSKKIIELKAKQRKSCMELIAAKAKEKIYNICDNRKVFGRFLSESPYCKKDSDKPDAKEINKIIAAAPPRERKKVYLEQKKIYDEAIKKWQLSSGKCVLIELHAPKVD